METIKKQIIDDNYIEKLYKLIIESKDSKQTFLDNLYLWKDFYNNRFTIFKAHILNDKFFTIIKFLLENEQGEIFDYFHDNIIELLSREQEGLTFKLRNSEYEPNSAINQLFTNLKNHYDLCEFLKTLEIEDIFGNIKKYQTKTLELYTLDSLIIPLHQHFFEVSPDVLRKTVDCISNNSVLFQKDNVKNNIINKDLIFQYVEKIIPIKEFLGNRKEDDLLIQKMKNYEIEDKQLLLKILKLLSVGSIYRLFDNDLTNFINFLERANYLNEVEKQSIINQTFDKFLEEDALTLLPLIVKNNSSQLSKRYLTDEHITKIITESKKEIPICFDDYELKYLLENDLVTNRFKTNIVHFLNHKELIEQYSSFDVTEIQKELKASLDKDWHLSNLSPEQKIIKKEDSLKVKASKAVINDLSGEIIPFETVIELLKGYLSENVELKEIAATAIFRSLATHTMELLNIDNNGVYFYDDKTSSEGYFTANQKIIGINRQQIVSFLDNKETMYNRLKIFDTIFHEIKHAKINQNKVNNIWNIEAYDMEKENISRKYDHKFYKNNYKKTKEEIQARISGGQMTLKFIETYFPEYLDSVQNQIIADLESDNQLKKSQNNDREMDFLGNVTNMFNHGFDTLIKYNPDILKEYPILNLEYYPNGIPKKYEDIWLSKNEENQELIEEILKIRYPEMITQELKPRHI